MEVIVLYEASHDYRWTNHHQGRHCPVNISWEGWGFKEIDSDIYILFSAKFENIQILMVKLNQMLSFLEKKKPSCCMRNGAI